MSNFQQLRDMLPDSPESPTPSPPPPPSESIQVQGQAVPDLRPIFQLIIAQQELISKAGELINIQIENRELAKDIIRIQKNIIQDLIEMIVYNNLNHIDHPSN